MKAVNRLISVILVVLIIFSSVPFYTYSIASDIFEELYATVEQADKTLNSENQLQISESAQDEPDGGEGLLQNPELYTAYAIVDDNSRTVHYEDSEGNIVNMDVEQENLLKDANFPSSYDARTEGIVTSVKNQGNYGTCWAFATVANIETYLLKYGMASSATLDLSENHLVWFSKFERTTDTSDRTYGDGTNVSNKLLAYKNGGSWYDEVATLTRGSGPVSESASPYLSDVDESLRYAREYSIENYIYIKNPTEEQIKENILTYGSVIASYKSNNSGYGLGNYYDPTNDGTKTSHEVLIIGWDDNYSASNFKNVPPSDGAWLVKNSWGTSNSYMTDGYFWLSYCEASLIQTMNITLTEAVDNIYQYECTGPQRSTTYKKNTIKGANVYTADSDEIIKTVGFYCMQKGSTCRVRILTLNSLSDAPNLGTVVTEQTCTVDFNGYTTVTLDNPVTVSEGQIFAVEIKIMTPGSEYAYLYLEGSENVSNNLSYISTDDSYSWKAYTGYDLCIKATSEYTVHPDIWDGTVAEGFESGTGTEADPYIIKTAEQLAYLSSSANAGTTYEGQFIRLANDIYLNDTGMCGAWGRIAPANTWTPVGTSTFNFAGTFDGAGHTVFGIYTNVGNDCTGLFGCSSGTVKNVGVKKSYICGNNCVGGVCGENHNGTVLNCYCSCKVSGKNNVGGICGKNSGIISNCYNTDGISGTYVAGGVCGFNLSGTISNCYNIGTVYGKSGIGGVCGDNAGTVTNCYYLLNCAKDSNNTVQNGIGNEIQGQSTADISGTTVGLTEAQMQQKSSFVGFDLDTVWFVLNESSNYKYPLLYAFHVHKFVDSVIAPTCTEKGYTTHKCCCGYEKKDTYVNAVDHRWSNPIYYWKNGNCLASRNCLIGFHSEREVVAGTYVKDTDATCTENEKGHYEATFVNPAFEKQATKKNSVTQTGTILNHSYTSSYESNSKGHWRKCSVCSSASELEVHVYSDGSDATCNVCNYTRNLTVYGDVNGDETINGQDVVRLKKYLANYDYSTNTSTVEICPGADANGDGNVNGQDVVRLKKYLANYDYDTNTSTIKLGP